MEGVEAVPFCTVLTLKISSGFSSGTVPYRRTVLGSTVPTYGAESEHMGTVSMTKDISELNNVFGSTVKLSFSERRQFNLIFCFSGHTDLIF